MDEVAVRLECLRLACEMVRRSPYCSGASDDGKDAHAMAERFYEFISSDPATAPVPHPARDE